MENISQKTVRRGRPRKATDAEWSITVDRQGHSYRDKANYLYRIRAISHLYGDPRFAWLCNDSETIMRGEGHMRQTILGALGRIEDVDEMEAMALVLCEYQPTTRQALAMIRQFRLGTRPLGTLTQLADLLRRTIATYQVEHAPLAVDDIVQALHDVAHELLMALRDAEP
jgi:hypothetical protein